MIWEASYRCILLQQKEYWKYVFQHTPTFSIEPNKENGKEPCRVHSHFCLSNSPGNKVFDFLSRLHPYIHALTLHRLKLDESSYTLGSASQLTFQSFPSCLLFRHPTGCYPLRRIFHTCHSTFHNDHTCRIFRTCHSIFHAGPHPGAPC